MGLNRWMLCVGLGMACAVSSPARAQSVLEQLEKKLHDPAPAKATDTPKPDAEKKAKPAAAAALKPPPLPKPATDPAAKPNPAPNPAATEAKKPAAKEPEISELPPPATAPPVAELPAPKQPAPVPPPLPAPPAQPVPRQAGGPALLQSGQPSLGVSVVDVTEKMRIRYGLTVYNGAMIRSIREGGAAAQAGMPLGAVVVAIDGRRIQSADDLVRAVQTYRPGDQVELTYFESDRMGRKKVRLGQSSVVAVMPKTRESTADVPSPVAPRPAAAPEPALRMGQGPAPDRPLLRRLGQALDQIAPELQGLAPGIGRPPAARPQTIAAPASASEVAQLRMQLETLQKQIQQLQQRLAELEKKQK